MLLVNNVITRAACSVAFAFAWATQAQDCPGQWAADRFPIPGFDHTVTSSIVWNDGSGDSLYVGGHFLAAGSDLAGGLARWDAGLWRTVGGGVDGAVAALATFDDGSGPALYVGGSFDAAGGIAASNIARWDGSRWHPLGAGVNGSVEVLTVFDDGTGPALYAGGWFTEAGGMPIAHIARWDGDQWEDVGGGVEGASGTTGTNVATLAAYDDGSGPGLYAAGTFASAGGVPASNIARWDGVAWSAVGGGSSGLFGSIYSLAVLDSPAGSAFFAGGEFESIGGIPVKHVAVWDGVSWAAAGEGFDNDVFELSVIEEGGVERVYAGGRFSESGDGSRPLNHIARWNGFWWESVGDFDEPGFDNFVLTFQPFDDGTGPTIFIGGGFDQILDGRPAKHAAILTRGELNGVGLGVNGPVSAMATDGTHMYIGGDFTSIDGVRANSVARFDGHEWRAMSDGLTGDTLSSPVSTLALFDDGSGAELYAGGTFTHSGSREVQTTARWDSTTFRWEPLANSLDGNVLALSGYDDGSGPALFAAGNFSIAGGPSAAAIAEWDGSAWQVVGPGVSGIIHDLVSFDDGTGPALFAVGRFRINPSMALVTIARWDGNEWVSLSDDIAVRSTVQVTELAIFDDGTGNALYAAGGIEEIGTEPADGLIRWDGTSWTEVGGGVRRGIASGRITDLAVADDGQGPALFITGDFTDAGGLGVRRIARWDGTEWSSMSDGVNAPPLTLAAFDDGDGPALWAGGHFTYAGSIVSHHLAQWKCDSMPCRADIDGDGVLTVFDFLDFQNLFDAGSPTADIDGDGELTLLDFLEFQTLFALGC